jgi:hypothetical protein
MTLAPNKDGSSSCINNQRDATFFLSNTVCDTPDDGRKLRPKHVELQKSNKKTGKKLHLVGYLYN